MFPPSLRDAVDGFPLAIQIAIYTAVLIFALSVMAATVKLSRKTEPHKSESVVIQGFNASIADMKPIREGVEVLLKLLDRHDKFIDHQELVLKQQQRTEQLLQETVHFLKERQIEDEVERRLRDRRRDR